MFDFDALSLAMIGQTMLCLDLMSGAFVYGEMQPGLSATSPVGRPRGDGA
jgi:hypothetical protein